MTRSPAPDLHDLGRRRLLAAAGAALGAAGLPGALRAQPAPAIDTVRIVTGFTPGGTSDTICRRVADRLRGSYARTAVVENRTGAGGQVAIDLMRAAPRDGSTILQTPASMLVIYPHIYRKLPYDPVNDVTPVTLGCNSDFGFAVGPMVPASVRTVNDFVAWCKANPDKANYGSPAAGSTPHFIGALLGLGAKIDLKHVAFRGTQPAILDMIGGQIAAVSGPVGEFTQHVAAGKCRMLATSGPQRSRFATDVPTFTEQGFRDLVFREWFGFYLPGKPEAAVIARANAALRAALAAPETVEGLATMGLEAASSTPEELAAMQKADLERWGPIVKTIGFTAES
ncbi:MAG TPA: Bug family tripartite tricarboxylate transporter substrate binding protein [Burkholderiaceae bacterium]|nr:Bug family tripartite tricarboxylate transporter substrate binding protein [Burkholderiaceae bacterium]